MASGRAGELIRVPRGLTHAKTMGRRAPCAALNAQSSIKFFELAWPDKAGERCPGCAEAAEPHLRAARQARAARRAAPPAT